MSLLIQHRIMSVRMRFIAFRQQHRCADINGLSPELGQQFALELDVLYILSVAGRQRRGNFVVKIEPDFIPGQRIQMKMAGITEQISGRFVELLPFPLVHVRPDGVAVSALETRINIQQRLHVIVPGGQFTHRLQRISQRKVIERGRLPWL